MVSTIKSVGDFETEIDNAGDKLVVLDFYASWCGPCKQIDPYLRKLVDNYKDRVIVLKINVDKFHDICDYYKVKSMPTFVFIKNKRRVSSFAGADANLLAQKMASLIK